MTKQCRGNKTADLKEQLRSQSVHTARYNKSQPKQRRLSRGHYGRVERWRYKAGDGRVVRLVFASGGSGARPGDEANLRVPHGISSRWMARLAGHHGHRTVTHLSRPFGTAKCHW